MNSNSAAQNSTSSLNSSYIWREASPNSFNMYSASVSSLNTAYRYSLGAGSGSTTISAAVKGASLSPAEHRAVSEERSQRKKFNSTSVAVAAVAAHQRFKTGSGYDNVFMTPLLPRKNKQAKVFKTTYQTIQRSCSPPRKSSTAASVVVVSGGRNLIRESSTPPPMGLYDRRLNRSFEAPQGLKKASPLRRSTPHLAAEEIIQDNDSHRQSATWCCGNFVMKQWRKMNNYD